MSARPVVLGRVSGLFGTAGWVKVFSYTQPPANILDYSAWYLGAANVQYELVAERCQAKTLVAQLATASGELVADRDAAAALVGSSISVHRNDMPALPAGEYYWCDLVGSSVYNRSDVYLGRVAHVLETGAADVLVLAGERERLVPFAVDTLVDSVDVEIGIIRVDWPADA